MSSVVTWTDTAPDFMKAPTYGGIMRTVDSSDKVTLVPWSGTDPDSTTMCYSWDPDYDNGPGEEKGNWTFPVELIISGATKQQGPVHDGMYRSQTLKYKRLTRETCTKYTGDVKFNGISPKDGTKANMSIVDYKAMLRQHHIRNGMWDIFHMQDAKSGTYYDLFVHHARFTLQEVKDIVDNTLIDRKCQYINENLDWSGQYIRNSLSADLLQKLLREVPITATGPVTLVALLRLIQLDSYEAMELTKEKLKKISLKNYGGENVKACCADIAYLSEQLDSAGCFEAPLLCSIAKTFETASEERFRLWAMKTYDRCKDYVKVLRIQDESTISVKLTYETLTQDAIVEYRKLIGSNRWCAAVSTDNDDALPALYKAFVKNEVNTALKQVDFSDKAASGTSNSTGGASNRNATKICYGCNKVGHIKPNCPDNKAETTESNNQAWQIQAPTSNPSTATLTKYGRTYKWCSTCGRWMFHHAAQHDAWAIWAKAQGISIPTANVATSTTTTSDHNEEATSEPTANLGIFGGLTPIWQI